MSLYDTTDAPLHAFQWLICRLLELRGVHPEQRVVFYDQDTGQRAARGYWLLRNSGPKLDMATLPPGISTRRHSRSAPGIS